MSHTTREDIQEWISRGKKDKQKWMIVVCDTFDYEDYPVYAKSDAQFWEEYDNHNGVNMQSIMETYNLEKDIDEQMDRRRCYETPKTK